MAYAVIAADRPSRSRARPPHPPIERPLEAGVRDRAIAVASPFDLSSARCRGQLEPPGHSTRDKAGDPFIVGQPLTHAIRSAASLVVAGLVLCPGCTRSGQGSVSTTPPGAAPATRFGPDGASLTGRIAFSAGAASREDIFAVDADGTGLRRLTTGPAADVDPSWSPDGRRVAFCRQEGDGSTAEIYVMNADGSGQRNLTNNSVPDWGPAWSPDGKLIAFGSERDGPVVHLFLMRP